MFNNSSVEEAVDIVGTHTYADPNHNANWDALRVAANGKPVWVTESANLQSTDQSMTDAANYIKWILRGFNEGGVTAYMLHLFYEEADNNGYSSLVAWTPTGQIILPKRYYTFKHFTNLVKKGYSLINSSSSEDDQIYVGAFISEDESKIVLQVFNEGDERDFSIDIPFGGISFERFLTSDSTADNFSSQGFNEIDYSDRYFTATFPELSLTSFVFNIDGSLSNNSFRDNIYNKFQVKFFPNPSEEQLNLIFPEYSDYLIEVFDLKGNKILSFKIDNSKQHLLDISSLGKGIYLINIKSLSSFKAITHKIIKE